MDESIEKISSSWDLVIHNGTVLVSSPTEPHQIEEKQVDLAVKDGCLVHMSPHLPQGPYSFEARGLHILPGIIDSQVHFRDPGHPDKEDFTHGTQGAVLGGVTAIFDMPNTQPNTSTVDRYLEKLSSVESRAFCDFALFAGATNENESQLSDMEKLPGCCGVKIFMGSSTGDLLVSEDRFLKKALESTTKMVAVHCEDESTLVARKSLALQVGHPMAHPRWRNVDSALRATQRIVKIAQEVGRKIHVLHITTRQEMEFLKEHKRWASVEILPQHLVFSSPQCYKDLGTRVQMNPPIREKDHQDRIKKALQEGLVDVVASDHAPHTLGEKQKPYPQSPSGMPGVQTIVPIMLNFVNQGLISLAHLVRLMSIHPAQIYRARGKGGIFLGQDGDFTVVDMRKEEVITDSWVRSRCGWTPYHGMKVRGWPVATFIRGHKVMEGGKILKSIGKTISFECPPDGNRV